MRRFLVLSLLVPAFASGEEWVGLFNGKDLSGWTPKIRSFRAGEDPLETFRVEDGAITVSYENYDAFDDRFGHLFYDKPYSHYRLRMQYRFLGEQVQGGPGWAIRNSGVMVHCQPPETMPPAQTFPISVEVQFLGGLGNGTPRPTGNVCSPGTNIVLNGEITETHCVPADAPTIDGDDWVDVEVLVRNGERVEHHINGERVMAYGGLTIGGGMVDGHDPAMKPDGAALAEGHIALQSESHPVQFRNIEILDLDG